MSIKSLPGAFDIYYIHFLYHCTLYNPILMYIRVISIDLRGNQYTRQSFR